MGLQQLDKLAINTKIVKIYKNYFFIIFIKKINILCNVFFKIKSNYKIFLNILIDNNYFKMDKVY